MKITKFLEPLQEQLGYKFDNPVLLVEALTHSSEGTHGAPEHILMFKDIVHFDKRKNYDRLRVLGGSVLKFLMTEYSVCHHKAHNFPPGTGDSMEGKGTYLMKLFMDDQKFTEIGTKLNLDDYIEVSLLRKQDPNFGVKKYYPDVVKAIFGAVFVDANDMASNSKGRRTRRLFFRLWKRYFPGTLKSWETFSAFEVEKLFPARSKNIWGALKQNGHRVESLQEFQTQHLRLKFETNRNHILEEALTHGSVRQLEGLQNTPTFDRLEFFGDAIYQLILCEYLFWYYVNEDNGDSFTNGGFKMQSLVGAPFQKALAKYLKIYQFIRKMKHVKVDEFLEDFFESVVGAVYVIEDGRFLNLRLMLVRVINRVAGFKKIDFPYSLRTYYSSKYYLFGNDAELTELKKTGVKKIHDDEALWPPCKQDSFKIIDYDEFLKHLHDYDEWKMSGKENNGRGKTKSSTSWEDREQRDCDLVKMKKSIPQNYCNRLEFERVSLFRVMARMVIAKSGKGFEDELQDYSYGKLHERVNSMCNNVK